MSAIELCPVSIEPGFVGIWEPCLAIEPVGREDGDRAISVVASERRVRVGVDSGAEFTVWPGTLSPEVPTEPSASSRVGVCYWGLGDIDAPTLPDMGTRTYDVEVAGQRRQMKVNVAPIRRPLLSVADLNDKGHDVFFMASGDAWARHVRTGEITQFERVGGRLEFEAKVLIPAPIRHPRRRGERL